MVHYFKTQNTYLPKEDISNKLIYYITNKYLSGGESIDIGDKLAEAYVTGCQTVDKVFSKGFRRNESGMMAGGAVGILVLLVTLMLCALLFGTLQGQTEPKIEALNDANATTSFNNIKTTGWGSIDLFSLVPYVAVFIIILGLLMGIGGNRN